MNIIGIIGAMEEEVELLKEKMTDTVIIEKAGMKFVKGALKGQTAVVVRSGIGKVNAGICTQILADEFQVEAVINTGIAGFQSDEALRRLAVEACKEVNPDIQVFEGRVASGDQFVADKETKEKIIENTQAYCTEMEGAAIGQAAYLNKIPYLVIRAISDKADDSAHVDYPTFERQAIRHTVNLVSSMMERL